MQYRGRRLRSAVSADPAAAVPYTRPAAPSPGPVRFLVEIGATDPVTHTYVVARTAPVDVVLDTAQLPAALFEIYVGPDQRFAGLWYYSAAEKQRLYTGMHSSGAILPPPGGWTAGGTEPGRVYRMAVTPRWKY